MVGTSILGSWNSHWHYEDFLTSKTGWISIGRLRRRAFVISRAAAAVESFKPLGGVPDELTPPNPIVSRYWHVTRTYWITINTIFINLPSEVMNKLWKLVCTTRLSEWCCWFLTEMLSVWMNIIHGSNWLLPILAQPHLAPGTMICKSDAVKKWLIRYLASSL